MAEHPAKPRAPLPLGTRGSADPRRTLGQVMVCGHVVASHGSAGNECENHHPKIPPDPMGLRLYCRGTDDSL